MTPEESIEIIEKQIVTCEAMIEFNENFDPEEDNTKFLKEKEALLMAADAIKEVQQYREIGTVEECREAREKQKPKAPKDELKINPVIDGNGAYVDADMTVYLLCPNCGELVGIDEDIDRFCHECGQAIQWDNLEGTEDENT